jgi:hypothetical protein
MSFSKSKPGRSLLQRLSDQRRSFVLGGLAVGAVFSAAVLRRKRRGGEFEFESPVPPSAQPDFGPPAAVDVPSPASEPETTDPLPDPVDTAVAASAEATSVEPSSDDEPADEAPINAGTEADDAAPTPTDPATGELNAEEASILAVLAQNGRIDEDRTAIAVATSLERETTDVSAVLRKLGSVGVVSGELYTATGDKIWAVTERGVRRLGAQH